MADNAINRGSQMVAWKSDAVIVPMIAGNAEGGKDRHTSRTCPRETSAIRRDRSRDGNETGQDRGNVSKRPKDGVYIVISFD